MTYQELFTKLLEKGYQPRPCGDHIQDAYCCAKAVFDAYEDFHSPAEAEDLLRDFLELDRREVFKVWFGEELVPDPRRDGFLWHRYKAELLRATMATLDGTLETCTDYARTFVLQNP